MGNIFALHNWTNIKINMYTTTYVNIKINVYYIYLFYLCYVCFLHIFMLLCYVYMYLFYLYNKNKIWVISPYWQYPQNERVVFYTYSKLNLSSFSLRQSIFAHYSDIRHNYLTHLQDARSEYTERRRLQRWNAKLHYKTRVVLTPSGFVLYFVET